MSFSLVCDLHYWGILHIFCHALDKSRSIIRLTRKHTSTLWSRINPESQNECCLNLPGRLVNQRFPSRNVTQQQRRNTDAINVLLALHIRRLLILNRSEGSSQSNHFHPLTSIQNRSNKNMMIQSHHWILHSFFKARWSNSSEVKPPTRLPRRKQRLKKYHKQKEC